MKKSTKKPNWKNKEFLGFITNTHVFIITIIIAIIISFFVLKNGAANTGVYVP